MKRRLPTTVPMLLIVIVSVAAAQLPAPHFVYPDDAQIIDVKRDFGGAAE
jgi:hypothetical protein